MSKQIRLLSDAAMKAYLINGFVTLKIDFPADFHADIYQKTQSIFATTGNPGNAILEKVPALQQVFDAPPVRGALTSILGPDYIMHPHRHCHLNLPGTKAQHNHQDSYEEDENVRHHRSRWAMAFYYPQDVSLDMGPTGVTPGSQYYYQAASVKPSTELAVTGQKGTVTIVHYDLWHRALANTSVYQRFMMKFLFCRMREPQAPSWNAQTSQDAPPFEKGGDIPDGVGNHLALWSNLWHWHSGSRNKSISEKHDLDKLIETLQHGSELMRLDAAYALGEIGEPAVPRLIEALKVEAEVAYDDNLRTKYNNPSQVYTAYALSAVGGAAVPKLVELLADDRWWIRAAAADILGDIGLEAQTTTSALGQATHDEYPWVRRNAIEALGNLGASAKDTVPNLALALRDELSWVRHNAALSLAKLGAAAEKAMPYLQAALSDENIYVKGNAAIALERLRL